MEDEAAELFIKIFGGFILFGLVLGLIAAAVFAAAYLGMLMAGIMSIYMVKTGAGQLVPDEEPATAILYSLAWAATLTVGCIVGSFALVGGLAEWYGSQFQLELTRKFGQVPDGWQGLALILDRWLFNDACLFFIKVTLVIYLANRISSAMRNGDQPPWLAVLPPLAGMLIFFAFDHWEGIVAVMNDQLPVSVLAQRLGEAMWLPFKLAGLLFRDPYAVIEWGQIFLRASEGSMFKIATLDTSIFCLIALGAGISVAAGDTNA